MNSSHLDATLGFTALRLSEQTVSFSTFVEKIRDNRNRGDICMLILGSWLMSVEKSKN
jgi:hypothetical protein